MRLLLLATSFPLLLALAAMSASQERPPVAARKPRLPLTVSKETTFFTAPLRQNGSVDYVEALNRHYGKGVTPENNAVVPLLRAFGGKAIPKPARAEFYRRLGIKPLPDKGAYIAPDRWDEEFDRALEKPWTREDCPRVAKWLDANAAALKLIHTSSLRSRWYLPFAPDEEARLLMNTIGVRLGAFQHVRMCARMLTMRAYLFLATGKTDAALNDVFAGHRLARHLDRDGVLISSLVATVVESVTAAASARVVTLGKMTFKQAIDYRKELEKLGPLRGTPDCYRVGERCFGLEFTVQSARASIRFLVALDVLPAEAKHHFGKTFGELFDLNTMLRSTNTFYDRILAISNIRDPQKRLSAGRRARETLANIARRSNRVPEFARTRALSSADRKRFSAWLSDKLIVRYASYFAEAMRDEDRANTRYDLTRVALALAAYRAERGKYPERLPAVVPRYIPVLPVDRFSGKPLKYRLTKKAFLLYSVGENGRDDGGKHGGGPDDIAVGD